MMKTRRFALIGLLLAGISASLAAAKEVPDLLEKLRKPDEVPFVAGERLRYEVNWKPVFLVPAFKAGELAFSVHRSEYKQHPTYTISAQARSEGLLSSVAGVSVQDYFESIVDQMNFRSYRALRKVRQNKRKRDLEIVLDYENQSASVTDVNFEKNPPERENDTIDEIPGPISDFISVFYVARLQKMKPGEEYRVHLTDLKNVKEIRLRVVAQEKVQTAMGAFNTVKISTVGGFFKEGEGFRVWYSTDDLRIPVKFEADVKVGKVYGQIIGLETPRMTRRVIQIP